MNQSRLYAGRSRSRVTDPAGPTPVEEEEEVEEISLEDVEEFKYDPNNHPIPHQPWRRGITAGCEDPIDASWRIRAEALIEKSIEMTGGKLIGVTWFLAHLLITIDDDFSEVPRDLLKTSGPVINVVEPENPIFRDPADPVPEDIWADEEIEMPSNDEVMEAAEDLKSKMYARPEEGEEPLDLDEEDIPTFQSAETREDKALRVAEEASERINDLEYQIDIEALRINTPAISSIAGAIIEALETEEKELRILERHEIVLCSPGAPDVLETQKEFDSHRGRDVAVETVDPWDSNRTLRGKLLDRNSMDILINQKGRMVTIPQNFVKCVRLPNEKGKHEGIEDSKEG
ncbi:unnamed protein product [Cylindrotheca closterium]|uniref:Uncharacterized protein n=1 Tax=Cylindrotheca closterium TaxID=2856 RepID=A0AAD2PVZ8_9STRA|nr:unnamed protein product [Cylindrotheca closterium]